jgi:hypothetical protein
MKMSDPKEKPQTDADAKAPRIRGVGNPESHSQDADRHRKTEHQKSDK